MRSVDKNQASRPNRTSAAESSTGVGNVPEGPDVTEWSESEAPAAPAGFDAALRLLARWLVKAAQMPQPAISPDPQNPVDVAGAPKVGLDRG